MKKFNTLLAPLALSLIMLTPRLLLAASFHDLVKTKDQAAVIGQIPNSQSLNEIVDGLSPLHLAIKLNLYDVVVALINAKTDKNILSADQETPACFALKKGRYKILEFLLQSGATITGERLYKYLSPHKLRTKPKISFKNDPFFSTYIEELLKHEDGRNLLPYFYPLFIKDKDFLSTLALIARDNRVPTWEIQQVINAMANADFPNGLPSKRALQNLAQVLAEIKATSKMQFKVWSILKSKRDRTLNILPALANNRVSNPLALKIAIKEMDAETIAILLTHQNAKLLQPITLRELKIWLRKPNASQAITDCINFNRQASNFFAYLIVSENNDSARKLQLSKLLDILQKLKELENYWGINQIIVALNKPEVSRLIDSIDEGAKQALLFFTQLINTENQLEYYKKVSTLDTDQPHVPRILDLLGELDTSQKIRPNKLDYAWLMYVGRITQTIFLLRIRNQSNILEDGPKQDLFGNMAIIPDDVIIEFSNLQRTMLDRGKREYPGTKMEDWTPYELFSALDQGTSSDVTRRLLEIGVWDGQGLVTLCNYIKNNEKYQTLSDDLMRILKPQAE